MSDSTPTWFLDVDGVINSYPAPKVHHVIKYGQYVHVEVMGFPIWYSPAVIDFINEAHRSGRARVVWLTTWADSAASTLAPVLGLDDFEWLPAPSRNDTDVELWDPRSTSWWKLTHVRNFLSENPGARIVWTDDDLTGPARKNSIYALEGFDALRLTPMSCPGLDPEHLARIDEFLDKAPVPQEN